MKQNLEKRMSAPLLNSRRLSIFFTKIPSWQNPSKTWTFNCHPPFFMISNFNWFKHLFIIWEFGMSFFMISNLNWFKHLFIIWEFGYVLIHCFGHLVCSLTSPVLVQSDKFDIFFIFLFVCTYIPVYIPSFFLCSCNQIWSIFYIYSQGTLFRGFFEGHGQ